MFESITKLGHQRSCPKPIFQLPHPRAHQLAIHTSRLLRSGHNDVIFFCLTNLFSHSRRPLKKSPSKRCSKVDPSTPELYRPYNLRHFGHQRSTLLLKHIPSKRLNARLSRIWKLTTYAASHCYIQHGAVPRRLIPVQ